MKARRYSGNRIEFELRPQPDDTTCGPTCLHGVYHYFGGDVPLSAIREEVECLDHGGTLAVCLGLDALRRGYRARIYTYNLEVFDPTWFGLDREAMVEKLSARLEVSGHDRRATAIRAYRSFLMEGGDIRMKDLSAALIRRYLVKGIPVLTGLSSTYLYQACREIPSNCEDDDIAGEPSGHFVVITGYDPETRLVEVADPWWEHPFGAGLNYQVGFDRLITAMLLGVLTYDANLLIIEPSSSQ